LTLFDLPPAHEVLGAMITPALLISATGTLVLSTSNRLARVVDRVRTLGKMAEELVPPDGTPAADVEDKRQLITEQLEKLSARIRYLVPAIATLYTAIGLLVASSISVGVVAVAGWRTSWFPVALGLIGVCALFYASTLLMREVRLAAGSTLNEMNYVRRVMARKTAVLDVKNS
jgi:Protein of unknown function (DUF2721)